MVQPTIYRVLSSIVSNRTASDLNSSVYRRRFASAMMTTNFTILSLIGVSVKSGELQGDAEDIEVLRK